MLDESIISAVIRWDALAEAQQAGVTAEHFVDEYRLVWRYILKSKRDHDIIPGEETILRRYPNVSLPRTRKREMPLLISDLHKRKKYMDLLQVMNDTAQAATSYDTVDEVIQAVQGQLNVLSFTQGGQSHLVDLFAEEARKKIVADQKIRRSGLSIGIPTGLKRFDATCGGLQKQKMYTVVGRPGLGKSWLDLLFVAEAVLSGANVILYPLEMTMVETAYRLYTLFSQKMLGQNGVMKNHDLTRGHIPPRKLARFMTTMEEKFPGSLLVADVGSLADSYTNERIEAEVDLNKPDMFWVDYLTLLKPPPGLRGEDASGPAAVKMLSNGIKNTAMRRRCVGGCSAQVSREALKANVFLPRLDHIAYGDSIGQDADAVVSINRRGDHLYYALVKHRGGAEFGKTKVVFNVNEGEISEAIEQDGDDDD